uniref:hypothetical protein n=1 Tax=Thermogutta sp. TaxID=1962930 RepID=UPI0032208947
AWEIMAQVHPELPGLFGDNGGDPDGNAWLRPVEEFPPELVSTLLREGVARLVTGYAHPYLPGKKHPPHRRWCGYQAEGVYFYY